MIAESPPESLQCHSLRKCVFVSEHVAVLPPGRYEQWPEVEVWVDSYR